MQTNHQTLNRYFAGFAFLFAFILYMLTLAPTASFWDPAERIAVAYGLQIPHPPGAPMYILMGRFFAMFVPAEYVAFSINTMSALASGITIMLLYLIVVRLIRTIHGHPDTYSTGRKVALYGGSLIGALTFAGTDSMWFISVEAETYALSLTFTALVFWLTLKWADQHDKPGNERWLVLIAYLIGIAFGIHLLNLLAIFAIGLIIYFTKFEFEIKTFILAGVASVGAFFLIFPGTIIWLPELALRLQEGSFGLIGPVMFLMIILLLLSFGIYYTHKTSNRIVNYILVAYTAIIIGYSSYAMIYLRSMTNPPIDQNNPDNVERFVSYMKREQYGTAPILQGRSYDPVSQDFVEKVFPRRHSSSESHIRVYERYNSDLDFFFSYQLGHMYFRYFNWNFIGRQADIQDTPSYWGRFSAIDRYADNPANNFYWYLPFLVGLLGMLYHFRSDWRRALAVLVLFTATGIAIVLYLNQTPIQPRERDYSYVGSFFAFSIWIGIGLFALAEMLEKLSKNPIVPAVGLAAAVILLPGRVISENYFDHDRSQRYVAPDYAYNLLNSVEPYSILFTNGDNDTFPLWYLQEVKGIRTDVRIVCLSLLNTPWYIDQLKNRWNYDSPPVRMSFSDREIQNIEQKFRFERDSDFHTPGTMSIPIDRERIRQLTEAESQEELITIAEHIETGSMEWPENLYAPEFSFGFPIDEMEESIDFFVQGQFLGRDSRGNEFFYTRVQDDFVIDIVRENINHRPVYFAITVSTDAQMNMMNYFRLEGKAFRVIPQQHEEEYGHLDPDIHAKRLEQFKLRNVNAERIYFDQNIRRMLDNYRTVITRQADALVRRGDYEEANEWLEWGEYKIPFRNVEPDVSSLITYALRYAQAGNVDASTRIADEGLDIFLTEIDRLFDQMDAMEAEMDRLEEQIRTTGSRERRARLTQQLNLKQNDVQRRVRDYSSNLTRLIVVQRVYFINGDSETAASIADEIDRMLGTQANFPRTEEENFEQFRRILI